MPAPIRCGSSQRCGGTADERHLHPLAARAEAIRAFARADRRLAGAAAAVPDRLGFGLGPVFQKAGQGSYLQFVAPGVVAMTVLFSSVFSGMGLLWDRQFGFLKETLVAPVPRIQIMLGRTLAAATVAVIQGVLVLVVCFIAGFRVSEPGWRAARAAVHGADRDACSRRLAPPSARRSRTCRDFS